jgi:hypothetical protein
MLQVTVNRRHLMVFTAVIAMLVSVAWVGVAQRVSAASSTPVVYVATGENFPDALGAAAAAAVQGGPVLLVQNTSIPAATAGELARLKPDVIYVAGGSDVVSDAVFDQLKAYAPSVIRVEGRTRYETAVEVSKSAFPATGGGGNTAALEARIAELEALLEGVSRNGDVLTMSGMNLQVVNGTGTTEGTPNSLGNVIIGYNEDTGLGGVEARTGSHYLILGTDNAWTSFGGIVAGSSNNASRSYSSVTGGFANTASGYSASVSGGSNNIASGNYSSVSGGRYSTAYGDRSSVSGGYHNIAFGSWSSVSGGAENAANGDYSSILGGDTRGVSGAHGTYPFCGC